MCEYRKVLNASRLILGIALAGVFASATYAADDASGEFEIVEQSSDHAVKADTRFEVISREEEKKRLDRRKTKPVNDPKFVIVRGRTPQKNARRGGRGNARGKCIRMKASSVKSIIEEIRGDDGNTYVIIR